MVAGDKERMTTLVAGDGENNNMFLICGRRDNLVNVGKNMIVEVAYLGIQNLKVAEGPFLPFPCT
jgi:hypothetical protein